MNIVQAKTTHGVGALLNFMQGLCHDDWQNKTDYNDFANMCSNFDKWVRETERTSIGRKQFEEWWEVQGTGEAGSWSDEALNEIVLIEDALPDSIENAVDEIMTHFNGVDNSNDAHRLKVENAELRKKNRELEEAVNRYERERKKMREMLMWGLNN
jgi:hypothetical protein